MNKNFLINFLSKKNQADFFYKAELIDLNLSEIICQAEQPTEYLYFPNDGFISILQSIDHHPPLEVGMIGREGVLGAEVILGANSNLFSAIVQGTGTAWKIKISDFLDETRKNQALSHTINAYIAVRMNQLGLSAACEHFHEIGPRLAKWLLMSQDRAQSSTFTMTHEVISSMLGVRRVGITTTAADFRRRGMIQYHRGEIQILNRTALIKEACSCYQKNRKIYASFIR